MPCVERYCSSADTSIEWQRQCAHLFPCAFRWGQFGSPSAFLWARASSRHSRDALWPQPQKVGEHPEPGTLYPSLRPFPLSALRRARSCAHFEAQSARVYALACLFAELPGPSGQRGDEAPSTSARTYIHLHGTPVPSEWLIRGIDSHKYPVSALMTEKETQKAIKDRKWAQGREQWLAAAAAGFHCAVFAYNLAFWGSDGMAPDRYWPANSRSVPALSVPSLASSPCMQTLCSLHVPAALSVHALAQSLRGRVSLMPW